MAKTKQYYKSAQDGSLMESSLPFEQEGQKLSDEKGYVPISEEQYLAEKGSSAGKGGISFPEFSEVGDAAGGSQSTLPYSASDVFSTREDYESRYGEFKTEAEAAAMSKKEKLRAQIMSQYEPAVQEATKYRGDVEKATKGMFATDRRLSTAASTFVDVKVGEAQKKINEIVAMRDSALAKLDTSTADELEKNLKDWKDNEKYWMDKKVEMDKEAFSREMQVNRYNLDASQFQLSVMKEQRAAQKDESSNALDHLTLLAESNFDPASFDAEEKSAYEEMIGVPAGTFDGIYGKIQTAKQLMNLKDEVGANKAIADLLNSTPIGTSIMIGEQVYGGRKVDDNTYVITKEDNAGNVVSVGIDKTTGNEKYRTNLGRIGTAARSTGTGSSDKFKFSADAKAKLLSQNFSLTDIGAIETNLANGYSIDQVLGASEGISEEQKTSVRNVMSGQFGKKEETDDLTNLSGDDYELVYMTPYLDEEGNLDVQEFTEKEDADVVLEAKRRGYFDEVDDAETKGWLDSTLDNIKTGYDIFKSTVKKVIK